MREMQKEKKNDMHRIVVFGVFDRLHPGHHAFLQFAKDQGDELIAILTRDEVARHFKGKNPVEDFQKREEALQKCHFVDAVSAGDTLDALGSYKVIHELQPDCLVFGYDQDDLYNDFMRFAKENHLSCKIKRAEPYEPHLYKSSLR